MTGKISLYAVLLIASVSVFLLASRISYVAGPLGQHGHNEAAVLEAFTTDTWGIFDPRSGALLYGENTGIVRPIASITKLFTAYAAVESDELDKTITITWSDLSTEGRAGKLSYGEAYTMHELLFPLLIESSNDAGEAIKRSLGAGFSGSVDALTSELGLNSTMITDGSGLGRDNVSTIEELARFYAHLRREHPHVLDITRLHMHIGETKGWINNDPAHGMPGFTGGKNGYTEEAGRTFIGTFKLPESDDEIGLVLLGSADFEADMRVLMKYIERAY